MQRQWLSVVVGASLALGTIGTGLAQECQVSATTGIPGSTEQLAAGQCAPGSQTNETTGQRPGRQGNQPRQAGQPGQQGSQATASSGLTGEVFTATGTILRVVDGRFADFWTSDISDSPQKVVLDLSWVRQPQLGTALEPKQPLPISVRVQRQSDGTYLVRELAGLGKNDMVNGANFGIDESWTTKDDSINARVGNVPEDDEALAQHGGFKQSKDKDDDKKR